jgi:hypothetical protein
VRFEGAAIEQQRYASGLLSFERGYEDGTCNL